MIYLSRQTNIIHTNLSGVRVVGHYPDNISCTNCYVHGFPCLNCHREDEIKTSTMDWPEFIEMCNHDVMIDMLSKLPESYQEFCELYELYHDIPELVDVSDDIIIN